MSSLFFPSNKKDKISKKPVSFFGLNPIKHSNGFKLTSYFDLPNTKSKSQQPPMPKFIPNPSPFFNSQPNLKNKTLRSKSKNNIKPVNFFHQFPLKRTKTEARLIDKNPFGDYDKDGVRNIFDCKPFNNKLQTLKRSDIPATFGNLTKKEREEGLKKWEKDSQSMKKVRINQRNIEREKEAKRREERLKTIIATPIPNFSSNLTNKKGIDLENIYVISDRPGLINATSEKDKEVRNRAIARVISQQERDKVKIDKTKSSLMSDKRGMVGLSGSSTNPSFNKIKIKKTTKKEEEKAVKDIEKIVPGLKFGEEYEKEKEERYRHLRYRGLPKKMREDLKKRDEDIEDYERETEQEERRESYDIPEFNDYDGGSSSIIKEDKRRGVALVQHHDSYSPASEMADTYDVRKKGGGKLWESGTTYTAEFLHEGADNKDENPLSSVARSERQDALDTFEQISSKEPVEDSQKTAQEFIDTVSNNSDDDED